MTATLDLIKQEIYDKVSDINDEKVLLAIQTLIVNLETQNTNQATTKRDLTGYIKEWVKNM